MHEYSAKNLNESGIFRLTLSHNTTSRAVHHQHLSSLGWEMHDVFMVSLNHGGGGLVLRRFEDVGKSFKMNDGSLKKSLVESKSTLRCAFVDEFEIPIEFFVQVDQVSLFGEKNARSLERFPVHLHGARVTENVFFYGPRQDLRPDSSVRFRKNVDGS